MAVLGVRALLLFVSTGKKQKQNSAAVSWSQTQMENVIPTILDTEWTGLNAVFCVTLPPEIDVFLAVNLRSNGPPESCCSSPTFLKCNLYLMPLYFVMINIEARLLL